MDVTSQFIKYLIYLLISYIFFKGKPLGVIYKAKRAKSVLRGWKMDYGFMDYGFLNLQINP